MASVCAEVGARFSSRVEKEELVGSSVPFRVLTMVGNGNDPTTVSLEYAPAEREAFEKDAEALIADAEGGPDLGSREGTVFECGEEVGFDVTSGVGRRGGVVDDFEVSIVGALVGGVRGVQTQSHGGRAGSCAVVGSEGERVAVAV